MYSIPAISNFHTGPAVLFVFSLSLLYKFCPQTVEWWQTPAQAGKCSLAARRSPRFQPPTTSYQEKISLTPEIN